MLAWKFIHTRATPIPTLVYRSVSSLTNGPDLFALARFKAAVSLCRTTPTFPTISCTSACEFKCEKKKIEYFMHYRYRDSFLILSLPPSLYFSMCAYERVSLCLSLSLTDIYIYNAAHSFTQATFLFKLIAFKSSAHS